jgi:ABC-type hemin transport system ATPase subunit
MRWIREHQAEYADQWVALDGDRVIAAGFDAKAVFAAAKAARVGRPLFVHMEPKDALPFGGW